MYKAILLSIGTPTTLGIYYEDMSQNKENLEEAVYTAKVDNESTLENKAPKLIFILRIDGKTSDVLPLLFVSHNLDKKTTYTSLESLLTPEVLSKCSLAECLIDSSFLQENKEIKHILETLDIKDSIDSIYSNQTDSANRPNGIDKGANLENLESIYTNIQTLYTTNNNKAQNTHLKIPHIGWNKNFIKKPHNLCASMKDSFYLYFVHSYHVCCDTRFIIAACDYGISFPSIIGKENILGIQPHPERSHEMGFKLMRDFLQLR